MDQFFTALLERMKLDSMSASTTSKQESLKRLLAVSHYPARIATYRTTNAEGSGDEALNFHSAFFSCAKLLSTGLLRLASPDMAPNHALDEICHSRSEAPRVPSGVRSTPDAVHRRMRRRTVRR